MSTILITTSIILLLCAIACLEQDRRRIVGELKDARKENESMVSAMRLKDHIAAHARGQVATYREENWRLIAALKPRPELSIDLRRHGRPSKRKRK